MLETTLLTGPYDWDPALTPQAEFDGRIAAVREVMRKHGLDGVFVGGTSPEHGALGYLTGFVPKLGPALAFIPAAGELRLAFSGGGAMQASAERLTYITKLHASRDPQQDCAGWIAEAGGTRFGLWGDYAITKAVRDSIDRAVPWPVAVLDADLDLLRRRKSTGELALIRRACDVLAVTMRTLRGTAANAGAGVRSAALAAERACYAAGAQDVRMLLSARDGGMPQPLIGAADPKADPLLACIAVRCAGYWAEGLATITAKSVAALPAAEAALDAMLKTARSGVAASQLAAVARHALAGLENHAIMRASLGNGIGMSREEMPFLAGNSSEVLQEGDVCTIRAGVAAPGGSAIVSAMIRSGRDGAELLWRERS